MICRPGSPEEAIGSFQYLMNSPFANVQLPLTPPAKIGEAQVFYWRSDTFTPICYLQIPLARRLTPFIAKRIGKPSRRFESLPVMNWYHIPGPSSFERPVGEFSFGVDSGINLYEEWCANANEWSVPARLELF